MDRSSYNNRNGQQERNEENKRKRKRASTDEQPNTPKKKQAMKETKSLDYYEVLEVDHNALDDDVKKAYHKLAMKWHPDKNLFSIEEADAKFKLIGEAYDALRDPHKRAAYDHHHASSANEHNDEEEEEEEEVTSQQSATGGSPFFSEGDDVLMNNFLRFWYNSTGEMFDLEASPNQEVIVISDDEDGY